MTRRYKLDELDDTTFQTIHETRNDRHYRIVIPPAKPERSFAVRNQNIIDLRPQEERWEPWYNWLSYEAIIGMLEDSLVYPYVEIEGVRIENSYADEEMQRFVAAFSANLEQLKVLCTQGHEDDQEYMENVSQLLKGVSENANDARSYMIKAGFCAGVRLGQKVRLEDLAEDAIEL